MKAAWHIYRRLLGYALPYRRVVAVSLLAMVAAAALEPMLPALLKRLTDEALIGKDPVAGWQVPLLMMLVFLGKGVAEYSANVASQWVAQRAIADLRQQVFDHQTGLPLATHQAQTHGRMLSRVLYDIPQVGQAVSNAWIIVVRDTLFVVGLTGYLIYTAWQLALLIVVVAPLIAWAIRAASRKLRGSNREMQQLAGLMTGQVESSLVGVKEIKIFGARAYEAGRFNALAERLRKATMRTIRVQAANVPLVQVLAAMVVSGMILFVTTLSSRNLLTPGAFFGFVTAMSMLFEPIRRLTNVNATIQAGLASAESIFGLLDEPLEPDEKPAGPAPGHGVHRLPQALVFDRVSFSYAGQDKPALADFSLVLRPGQTVALVGASGSGKSTVTNLLARFYLPGRGEILWGDTPIDALPLAEWRAQLALVGQQVVLFDDTLAANIAYGRPDVPREAIERAARAAHAWEFIERAPQGLDTPCGENGLNLSGGQRQRIAIARAFLKDAPLLILDEATSALDNESERQVQQALPELMAGRTTLIIAHRMSTIEHADLIVVLDQGRIVEQGRHAELLARGAHYARLQQAQFSAAE
ncbi:lipid A export permease/ATP-binding protein MsbA [Ideonella sp.]|uniref:lipid A export permease/ATP-binding protein MsbA n=1 Tax=Ideonella sp. TaxID=1929293 RepID=UPI002B49850B|nr:lipid A export permease/ATP-binding protein MsbA [Ideonella sp.]HJV70274.1 lipid A export permease/ATP-binding protein MsbA [Ideonella sp.]